MPSLQRQLLTNLSGAATPSQIYSNQVLSLSPTAYWKANEASGSSLLDYSGNAFTRTYSGQDLANVDFYKLPDKAPLWGTGDYVNLHGASFATAFNFAKGYLSFWYRVRAASVLTDATTRTLFIFTRDASNILTMFKTTSNNAFFLRYIAGGTTKTATLSLTDTGWTNIIVEWADAANGSYLKSWKNNAVLSSDTTGIGTVNGSGMSSSATCWGAASTAAAQAWDGQLAHFAIKASAVTDGASRSLLSAGQ